MDTMAKACRPMTFEEAIEAVNLEHARAMYKEKERMHIDALNRWQCDMSELHGEIRRLNFLVKTLTTTMMNDDEARRYREMEACRTKGSGGSLPR